jgi:hypothetical protein
MAKTGMISVTSSNIESIGYGEKRNALIVKFKNGGVYIYQGVKKNIFDEFLNAPSKGGYLDSEIKGGYPFERITESQIDQWLDRVQPKAERPRVRDYVFTGLKGATCFI